MILFRSTTPPSMPSLLLTIATLPSITTAQATFEFTDSGQLLGDARTSSVELADLNGDGDLDARLSRMLLGASTAAKPKHAPFFEASRVFQNKHVKRSTFWFLENVFGTRFLFFSATRRRPKSV